MFIYLIPFPQGTPLYYSLECFPTYCILVLDTIDQTVNEMCGFAGQEFKVDEIIACAPRESKA